MDRARAGAVAPAGRPGLGPGPAAGGLRDERAHQHLQRSAGEVVHGRQPDPDRDEGQPVQDLRHDDGRQRIPLQQRQWESNAQRHLPGGRDGPFRACVCAGVYRRRRRGPAGLSGAEGRLCQRDRPGGWHSGPPGAAGLDERGHKGRRNAGPERLHPDVYPRRVDAHLYAGRGSSGRRRPHARAEGGGRTGARSRAGIRTGYPAGAGANDGHGTRAGARTHPGISRRFPGPVELEGLRGDAPAHRALAVFRRPGLAEGLHARNQRHQD